MKTKLYSSWLPNKNEHPKCSPIDCAKFQHPCIFMTLYFYSSQTANSGMWFVGRVCYHSCDAAKGMYPSLRIYFSRYIQKQRSIGLYGTDSLQTQKVFLHSLKNIYEKTITYHLQIQDKRTSLPQLVMAPNRQITRVCSSLDIGIFSGSERCLLFLFTCRWDKKMDFSPLHGVQFGIIANSTSIPAHRKR